MKRGPDRLTNPLKATARQAKNIGGLMLNSLSSRVLAERLLDEEEQTKLEETADALDIAVAVHDEEMQLHQAKIYAQIRLTGLIRRIKSSDPIDKNCVVQYQNIIQDLPPGITMSDLWLKPEEVAALSMFDVFIDANQQE